MGTPPTEEECKAALEALNFKKGLKITSPSFWRLLKFVLDNRQPTGGGSRPRPSRADITAVAALLGPGNEAARTTLLAELAPPVPPAAAASTATPGALPSSSAAEGAAAEAGTASGATGDADFAAIFASLPSL